MRRERILGGVALAVVLAAVLAAVALPGARPQPAPDPPGELTLRETPITPLNASGDTATLSVTNWIAHRGGPVENVTLLVRAVDAETGFVETRARADVGTIGKPGDHAIRTNLTVERSGGYEIQTLVFADGRRVATGTSTISGVDALTPGYADAGLRFHRFSDLPTIAYGIEAAEDGRVRLDATAFLTNGGSSRAEDLRLLVRARQSDSNIVADRAVVSVDDVRPGRTATPSVDLTVPDNYTYRLDAILTRDGVIVDTETAVADLDPTRTVEANETTESVDIQAESFAGEDGGSEDEEPTGRPETTVSGGGPGFGAPAALAALCCVIVLFGRRNR